MAGCGQYLVPACKDLSLSSEIQCELNLTIQYSFEHYTAPKSPKPRCLDGIQGHAAAISCAMQIGDPGMRYMYIYVHLPAWSEGLETGTEGGNTSSYGPHTRTKNRRRRVCNPPAGLRWVPEAGPPGWGRLLGRVPLWALAAGLHDSSGATAEQVWIVLASPHPAEGEGTEVEE